MSLKVGIIGAGMAGLSLAVRLIEAGHSVVLVDKGRGVGGRMSTRRAEALTFDHGAQYFTVRDPRFRAFLEANLAANDWARWDARFGVFKDGRVEPETRLDPRYVGVAGMNAIVRAAASKFDVRIDARIVEVGGGPGAWSLVDANGVASGPFDRVVATAPPAQSAALLDGKSTIAERINQVRMQPCFTLMIEPSDETSLPFDGIRAEHPVLGWLANNHSKPGRAPKPALVVQSNHHWAEAHVNDPLSEVGDALKRATLDGFGINLDSPSFESVHRWLYARPVEPLGQPFAIDRRAGLAACGDWCVAGKVEGAFLSGLALAEELIRSENPDDLEG